MQYVMAFLVLALAVIFGLIAFFAWLVTGPPDATTPYWVGLAVGAILTSTFEFLRRYLRSKRTQVREVGRHPWPLSDQGIAGLSAAIVAVGVGALLWMLNVAGNAPVYEGAANRFALRIDAIKYGLGAVAAAGGMAALLLALRRQRHTEDDAVHRRFTELYTKAVEQIGADSAAIRLGGLYALERVGQDNPDERQTVVNVLCAYLRMPQPDSNSRHEQQQEREIRLAAQSILAEHLSAGGKQTWLGLRHDPDFWPNISLDLAGADLHNWKSMFASVENVNFSDAVFTGETNFTHSGFRGVVRFNRAVFQGAAWLRPMDFGYPPDFAGAKFLASCNEGPPNRWPKGFVAERDPDDSKYLRLVHAPDDPTSVNSGASVPPMG